MKVDPDREPTKEQVRRWLVERYKVKEVPDVNANFNFLAEDGEGKTVDVIQPKTGPDDIIIATGLRFTQEQARLLADLDLQTRDRMLWNLRFGLLNLGVEFSSIEWPLEHIEVSKSICLDGTTKNSFRENVSQVSRALRYAFWTVDQTLGAPPSIRI